MKYNQNGYISNKPKVKQSVLHYPQTNIKKKYGSQLENKDLISYNNNIQLPLKYIEQNKNSYNSKSYLKQYENKESCNKNYYYSSNNSKELYSNNKVIFEIESFNYFVKSKKRYKNKNKSGKIYIRNTLGYNINEKSYKEIKSYNVVKELSVKNNYNEIKYANNNIEQLNHKNFIKDRQIQNQKNIINDKYYNIIKGLYNFGNTCYFNSFIQIFIHIPGLIKELMNLKNIISKNSLLYSLLNFANNPSTDNLYVLRISFIHKNPNYNSFKQQDSQEFGKEFLKAIDKELEDMKKYYSYWNFEKEYKIDNIKDERIKKKLDKLRDLLNNKDIDFQSQTIINYFFYYYKTSLIICNNKILNVNYCGDIDNQLSFEKNNFYYNQSFNLIDMLKKKYLYGSNKLIRLPIVFNITLLRAIINVPLIQSKVEIEQEIDLKDFLDKDFGNYLLPTKYILYALNICIGSSKKYGHYYSYILINDEWFKFDDFSVMKVNKDTIEQDKSYIYGIYYINKAYLNNFY